MCHSIGSPDIQLKFRLLGILWNCLITQDGYCFSSPFSLFRYSFSSRQELELCILGLRLLMRKLFFPPSGKFWTLKLTGLNRQRYQLIFEVHLWHLEFHYWTISNPPTQLTTFWNSPGNSRYYLSRESWESVSPLVSRQGWSSWSGVSVGDSCSISSNVALLSFSWKKTTRSLLSRLRMFWTGVWE